MGKRGPQPKPYKTYQRRYPKPLEGEIDKLVEDWKKKCEEWASENKVEIK